MLNACQRTEAPTSAAPVIVETVTTTTPVPIGGPTNTPAPAKPSLAPTGTILPTASITPLAGMGKKVCQVTDTGGIDDKFLNSPVWKGLSGARNELGVEVKYLESAQPTDYAKNINAFVQERCDLIITVGQQMGDDTKTAAEKNPNQKFAIVDDTYDPTIPNVIGLTFATDQAGFLAGYLAAGISKTGRIGTFGGTQTPSITSLMNGFYYGAQYYNQQNNTKVQVFGWDPKTQKGSFTGDLTNPTKARTAALILIDQGADVIMPAAGPAGVGAAEGVKLASSTVNRWIIGTETDWTTSAANYKEIILTSAIKNMDVAIFDTVKTALDGSFKGGVYVGTLQNGGVGLTAMSFAVSPDLKAKLDQVKADIIAGKIKVNPNVK